jgi:hypothetical protein
MVQVHRFLAVFLGPQCVPYAQDVLGALAACIGQVSQRLLAVLEAEAGPQVFEVRSDNEKELSQDSDLFGRRNVPRLISRVG